MKPWEKAWRRTRNGRLVHDSDCHFWSWDICSCGLLHHLNIMDSSERERLYPNFGEDHAKHRGLLAGFESGRFKADPPASDEEAAEATERLFREMGAKPCKCWHVVEFHAWEGEDGYCGKGTRAFEDHRDAWQLASILRDEPNHVCGPDSVRERLAIDQRDGRPEDEGDLPPSCVPAWEEWLGREETIVECDACATSGRAWNRRDKCPECDGDGWVRKKK
jgi:hypothetical protein